MKKVLFLMLSLILFCSCQQKEKSNNNVVPDSIVVENIISIDKQAMYQINPNYRWLDTL